MSTVYLLPATEAARQPDLVSGLSRLWDAAGLADCFGSPDLTAIKLHVGEPGTKRTFVSPAIVAELVRLVAATDARPFLTDTAVLYRSPRNNGAGHARVAVEHGYGLEATGAPFVPADGLNGDEDFEIEVSGEHGRARHYDRVAIASAIVHARSMLVLSHATGHLGTGFGGAIKNLGMGCCSKRAKLRQHHGHKPRIDEDACRACEVCAEWCPSDAITVDGAAVIDHETCVGCGECIAACLEGAVEFDWSQMGESLSERIAEHALGAARGKDGHIAYVTVAMDITKDCDCIGEAQDPVAPDVGILAGTDPVALDRAVLDLVAERAGRPLEALAYAKREPGFQVAYAEFLGLGSVDYELVTV